MKDFMAFLAGLALSFIVLGLVMAITWFTVPVLLVSPWSPVLWTMIGWIIGWICTMYALNKLCG